MSQSSVLLRTLIALTASMVFTACGAKVTASGDKTHIATEDFYAPLTQLEVPTWFFSEERNFYFSHLPEIQTVSNSFTSPSITIYKVDSSKNSTRNSTFYFSDIPQPGRITLAAGPFVLSPGTTDSTSTCSFTNTEQASQQTDMPDGLPSGTPKAFQCRIVLKVKGITVNTDSVYAGYGMIIGNSASETWTTTQVVLEYPAGTDTDSAYVKVKGSVAGLHDNLILGKVKVEEIELTGSSN